MALIEWVLLLRPATSYIFLIFHNLTYLSAPPVANVSPVGLKASAVHGSVWATILNCTSYGKFDILLLDWQGSRYSGFIREFISSDSFYLPF